MLMPDRLHENVKLLILTREITWKSNSKLACVNAKSCFKSYLTFLVCILLVQIEFKESYRGSKLVVALLYPTIGIFW